LHGRHLSFVRQMQNRSTVFLGSWFRASCSKYVYEYPTRCNDNILVLFQDL
jgi:hypothetical protein